MKKLLPSLLALVLSLGCVTTPPPAAPVAPAQPWAEWKEPVDGPDEVRLTIVGTNDLHGWVEPKERPAGPEGEPLLGGIDAFSGYLRAVRETRPDRVVLVDAGDMFQGTLVVNMTKGAVVIKAYNLLGYDGAAIGNHEFDYGPEGDPVVALTEADDPLGNVKKRIAEAKFPLLVGNVFEKKTGEPVKWENAKRTHLVERSGVMVGLIGLSTPTTPSVTLRQNVEQLDFRPLAKTTEELAAELRSRGAGVVVVVMHAGGGCEHYGDPVEVSSCDPSSEIWELTKALPPGTVDAIVAGHTHQYLAHYVNGVPSIQSSSFGVAFGMIELVYDKAKKKVDPTRTKIWQPQHLCRKVYAATGDCRKDAGGPLVDPVFLGRTVKPDAELAAALRPELKLVETRKNEELGPVLARPFGRSRTVQSELGDFVADVMHESIAGVKVAFTNSGGLRADLLPGPLSYGDVFNALPFENRLSTMKVNGTQLVALLRQGVGGKHGIIQVSGVKLEVAEPGATACDGSRLVSATFDDGSPIDPAGEYLVVTNDFVAGGGDGFDAVLKDFEPGTVEVRNDLPPLREVVAAWLRGHPQLDGPAAPATGRITFVTPKCGEAPAAAPAQ